MNKPFWWKARGAWFVKVARKNQRLHEDEKEAYEIWGEMQKVAAPESPVVTFVVLADHFLEWAKKNNRTKTFKWRKDFLLSAAKSFGDEQVRNLKPFHVSRWLDTEPTWNSETHRGAIASVKRCLNWACEEGLLESNPLARVKKPAGKRREGLISDAEHKLMMLADDKGRKSSRKRAKHRHACFRHVMVALRHSGARPGTVAAVRVEDVIGGGWVLHQHKTRAKTGRPLVVYLSPCLQTLTRILAAGRDSGPLFRNSLGKAWTSDAIGRRMQKLREKLKLPESTVAYAYRHTYITTAMVNGTNAATVAELIGHSDLKMISQFYGHLDKHKEHLKQAAAQAMRKQA